MTANQSILINCWCFLLTIVVIKFTVCAFKSRSMLEGLNVRVMFSEK
jgi:hypothetical protein